MSEAIASDFGASDFGVSISEGTTNQAINSVFAMVPQLVLASSQLLLQVTAGQADLNSDTVPGLFAIFMKNGFSMGEVETLARLAYADGKVTEQEAEYVYAAALISRDPDHFLSAQDRIAADLGPLRDSQPGSDWWINENVKEEFLQACAKDGAISGTEAAALTAMRDGNTAVLDSLRTYAGVILSPEAEFKGEEPVVKVADFFDGEAVSLANFTERAREYADQVEYSLPPKLLKTPALS